MNLTDEQNIPDTKTLVDVLNGLKDGYGGKTLAQAADRLISQAQRIAELEESRENTLNLLEASQGRIRRQEIEAHELQFTNTSLRARIQELQSQRDHFQSEATRLRGMCIDKANGMAELQSQLDEYREDPKDS